MKSKLPYRRWTAEEDRILTEMYPDHSNKDVVRLLGRTEKSVYARANLLQLRKSEAYMERITEQRTKTLADSQGTERHRQRLLEGIANREQARKRDRLRKSIGLRPLTNMATERIMSKRLYQARWHLMHVLDYEPTDDIYTLAYTEDTHRTRNEQLYTNKYRLSFVPQTQDDV